MIFAVRPGFGLVLDDPTRPPVLGGLGLGILIEAPDEIPSLVDEPWPSSIRKGQPVHGTVEVDYLDRTHGDVITVQHESYLDKAVHALAEKARETYPEVSRPTFPVQRCKPKIGRREGAVIGRFQTGPVIGRMKR